MSEPKNNLVPTEAQAPPLTPDISAEPATSWIDWAVVAAVLAVALWYLYRKLWAKRGECGGCAKGKSGCAVQTAARRARADCSVQVPIDRIGRSG